MKQQKTVFTVIGDRGKLACLGFVTAFKSIKVKGLFSMMLWYDRFSDLLAQQGSFQLAVSVSEGRARLRTIWSELPRAIIHRVRKWKITSFWGIAIIFDCPFMTSTYVAVVVSFSVTNTVTFFVKRHGYNAGHVTFANSAPWYKKSNQVQESDRDHFFPVLQVIRYWLCFWNKEE